MFARFYFLSLFVLASFASQGQPDEDALSVDGFKHWLTGHDAGTEQLAPQNVRNPLIISGDDTVAYVKFIVRQYGEVSFPINGKVAPGQEPPGVDLRESKFVSITYRSNQEVVLQLRQTGVHGGVHNHITLPAAKAFVTYMTDFAAFRGGITKLDIGNVSKFNFAFLSNNEHDGFSELVIKNFVIDHYQP